MERWCNRMTTLGRCIAFMILFALIVFPDSQFPIPDSRFPTTAAKSNP
ncbi:MAG: hypothetical protein F6J90_34075 [Moorea sp. SIOASIH]|nr:hypothetical protein [Moorena sp. SIOASIH]NEO41080.1 hypothetical protein [Moorena sp. SIOASIH]